MEGESLSKIFLSYRRGDSLEATDSIFRWLQERLPSGYVYRDINSGYGGEVFPERIEREIASSRVVLAIIGPNWRGRVAESGKQRWRLRKTGNREHNRIDDIDDWVRYELSTALAAHIPIIPVLVNNASLPALPKDLAVVRYFNAVVVRGEPDFGRSMTTLAKDLARYDPDLYVVSEDDNTQLIHLPTQRTNYLDALIKASRNTYSACSYWHTSP